MQSSTFTVNIFRHSALSTCNKYTSKKNYHKNLNFPKFFLSVCLYIDYAVSVSTLYIERVYTKLFCINFFSQNV